MKQPNLIVSIEVTPQLNVDVRMEGNKGLAVGLLGGIEVARDAVLDHIKRTCARSEQHDEGVATHESKVSKDEALGMYLEAWKTIEARIQSINSSDKNQQFIIDHHLFQNLGIHESSRNDQTI